MRIIFLFIFGLFMGPWQAFGVEKETSVDMDEAAFSAFLSDLKNPFAVQIPAGKTNDQAAHAVVRPSSVPAAVKTQAPPSKPFVAPNLKVGGVLWAGPKPQAIVNDRVVGIGDVVQDAKVAAIRQGEVEFSLQGNVFIVKVQK